MQCPWMLDTDASKLYFDSIQLIDCDRDIQECSSIWQGDRQACAVLSLTGKPCVVPLSKHLDDKLSPQGAGSADKPERADSNPQQTGDRRCHSSGLTFDLAHVDGWSR